VGSELQLVTLHGRAQWEQGGYTAPRLERRYIVDIVADIAAIVGYSDYPEPDTALVAVGMGLAVAVVAAAAVVVVDGQDNTHHMPAAGIVALHRLVGLNCMLAFAGPRRRLSRAGP
jgi:hypothetical protein